MKRTVAIPRCTWLAAPALMGALAIFLAGGCANTDEPPLTAPTTAEAPKPLASTAVQALLTDLESVYDAPDPLPAIVRYDRSLDPLAIADLDSLAIWVKSAAVLALAVEGRIDRLDCFEVNPGQRYGDRTAPGPFRAELSSDGIELILGLH